jgi:copper resistance protein C
MMKVNPFRLRRLAMVVTVLVGVVLPRALYAHAILVRSTPAAHAVVSGSALAIELHFNSRIDGGRSKLVLNAPDGKEVSLGRLGQPAPDTLISAAPHLVSGAYALHWIVLASDGHISRGEILFMVK